ncbi:U3-aranetoxin-Ce1a [Parasteatoda tepidariorum]|uniref:U3-aranetoxin-Ce1a n=1 Tax=Parasteatoda tepidariorum TaxID=114398 RepID=UPI001C723EE9|nr:U3-aranetoxin-Ce1a-like [Parasteatoda tepidariorum]
MKLLFFVLVTCLFCIWIAEGQMKRCGRSDECAEDECCQIVDTSTIVRKAYCKKLHTEGQECFFPYNDRAYSYIGNCPCADGLKCDLENTKKCEK